MFNIGDRVTSQRIGLPIVGEICGVTTGGFAREILSKLIPGFNFNKWDQEYNCWESNYVYMVLINNRSRPLWFPSQDLISIEDNF